MICYISLKLAKTFLMYTDIDYFTPFVKINTYARRKGV